MLTRRVRSDGVALGSGVSLGAQTADPYAPSVAYHPGANNYLVAWTDTRDGNPDAYGRLVDADGSLMSDALALEATADDQIDVTIAKQGANDDLFLAYTDNRNGNPDLYGERYVPPIASFAFAPSSGTAPLTVVFTDTSIAPNGIDAWLWSFGDEVTSTLQSPTHTYSVFGTYAVSLTVTSGDETDRSSVAQITVLDSPPPTTTLITYAYDGLYRLTSVTSTSGRSFEYRYDAVGNRLVYTRTLASQTVTTYTYDAANRLTSAGGVPHTWDANGNLLSDGDKTYAYDQASRLTNITSPGLAWNASYNGDSARLRQVVNGAPTTYTLDLAALLVQVLVQQDGSGTTRYLYGLTRIGEQPSTGWVYHLPDALGSVRQLTDGSAQVALARAYMPYGEALWSQGAGNSVYAFTGEQTDAYIKLVFLRARYMQPPLGIFLSHDPWEGDVLQPGSMNGFNYVEGNPINRVDPSGKWWWGAGQTLYDHSFHEFNNQNLHVRIQAYWMEGRPGHVHAEYVIPGTNLPVDLLNSVSGEMWEIKPWADRDTAWSELEPRIYAMIDAQRNGLLRGITPVATPYDWVTNGPDTWSPGISFPFDIYIGTDETGMYDFYASTYEAGVIVWWKVNRDKLRQVPYPIYVPWPMKKTDRNVRPGWETGGLTPAPVYAAAITGFIYGCLRVIQWGFQGFECVSTGVCQFSPP